MLHFPAGIAFCVDIADFFQLECAFQRQRVVWPAAEIKDIAGRRDQMRHAGDVVIMIQCPIKAGGRFQQMGNHLLLFFAAHQPLLNCHVRRQGCQHSKLAGEGLGRGDANLRSRMGRQQKVRLACHRTGWDIHNGADRLAVFLAMAQGRQGICRLTTLGNEQGETTWLENRVTIAEFRGNIDINRHAGELLEPVFGDHTCVKGGAAGHDCHAADRGDIEIELRQSHRIIGLAQIG